MQWNSLLADPRENVMVRQIRIEAWERWNVDAIIASIPALLQLAMALFLVGIMILLWSLDNIVAIVATIIISFLLAAISAFTVLPVYSKHCPYKSPTARACVVGYHFITAPIMWCVHAPREYIYVLWLRWKYLNNGAATHLSRLGQLISKNWEDIHDNQAHRTLTFDCLWPIRPGSWRERERDALVPARLRVPGWCPKYQDARLAAQRELAREEVNLRADGTFVSPPTIPLCTVSTADDLLRTISETSLLVRSLYQVERGSQDVRVRAYVDQSILSIYPHSSETPTYYISRLRAITIWALVSSLLRHDSTDPLTTLLDVPLDSPLAPTTITSLRRQLGVYSIGSPDDLLHCRSYANAYAWVSAKAPGYDSLVKRMILMTLNSIHLENANL